MTIFRTWLLFVVVNIISLNAFADSPSWNYAEVGYGKMEIDDTDIDLDGIVAEGSYAFSPHIFVRGELGAFTENLLFDDLDVDTLSAGIGWKSATSNQTDVYGIVSYERIESGDSDESIDGKGYSGIVGVKSRFSTTFEGYAEAGYIDVNDVDISGFTGRIGINAFFSDMFSVGVRYKFVDDFDVASAVVSVHF
ncbi:porin family protein [Aestuariibacter sp. AA17]|uniref:Porin family protein n=1 Tax=Fluctibacter corallii TaxID=2984329 RepID=A0ABT3A3Z1_9ALTE|nr:porin family protein [Aestuariibacter sp. AA17]MCV2883390.1 porin family protein [Aestuariibacter sp. AA17]